MIEIYLEFTISNSFERDDKHSFYNTLLNKGTLFVVARSSRSNKLATRCENWKSAKEDSALVQYAPTRHRSKTGLQRSKGIIEICGKFEYLATSKVLL